VKRQGMKRVDGSLIMVYNKKDRKRGRVVATAHGGVPLRRERRRYDTNVGVKLD